MKQLFYFSILIIPFVLSAQRNDFTQKEFLKEGDTILFDYYFAFSNPGLKHPHNDKVIDFFKYHTEVESVRILCHTDCRGTSESNKKLSQYRCDYLKNYLNDLFNSSFVNQSTGIGEERPLSINTDSGSFTITCDLISGIQATERKEELHKLNRRIEILILKTDSTKRKPQLYSHPSYSALEKGNVYLLPEIRFQLSKWELLRNENHNSIDSLKFLADFMIQHPNTIVEIMNHTDCRGSDKYSIRLSQKRAESVRQCMIEYYGINGDRLIAKGYEENLPRKIILPNGSVQMLTCDYINSLPSKEDQEKAHQMNRRTEFKILSLDYVEKE
ncbi:MAG: OmpA family protein [Crocinitomicaceae bacterium]|nr:OmpA family protein [Crocinitomicaceae bacterium]